MRYANFGSVISGTMRAEDLVEAFASELEYQVRRNAEEWCSDAGRAERDRLIGIVHAAREIDFCDLALDEIVPDMMDALGMFAPPYGYFGAHESDGSDYGYWLAQDAIDCAFDGLRVADTGDVPADYSGEVLFVSDHGNTTLYSAQNGELTEIWGII